MGEEEDGLMLFEVGTLVVIDTKAYGQIAGGFIGLTEFGVAIKMTHKEGQASGELTDSQKEGIKADLSEMTVKELQEMARETDLKATGTKAVLVQRIADVMVEEINESLPPRATTIELAVPTTTLISWNEIDMIQDGTDYLNDMEVSEFRSTIVDGLDLDQDEAIMGPGESDSSGE